MWNIIKMKFIEYLKESEENGPLTLLKAYVKNNKAKLSNSTVKSLIKEYPLEEDSVVYRGLNFDSQEEYDEFISKIKNGYIITDDPSSWSRSKGTARQFAKTKPSYMEFMSMSSMMGIKNSKDAHEHVVGYRGVILKTTAKKNECLDVNRTPYDAEDEVIIPAGKYKIEYEDMLKSSDKIKKYGIKKILDDIKTTDYTDNNEVKDLIDRIAHFNGHELDDSQKEKIASIVLKLPFTSAEKTYDVSGDDPVVIGTSIIIHEPLYKYFPKELFNDDIIKKYDEEFAERILKLFETAKSINAKVGEDAIIKWDTFDDFNEYLHKLGIVSEHRKLIRTYGKKYNKLNSMDTVKDINKLKGKDQKDAIERLMQQLTSTIKSM